MAEQWILSRTSGDENFSLYERVTILYSIYHTHFLNQKEIFKISLVYYFTIFRYFCIFFAGEHLTGEFRDKVSQFKCLPVINDENLSLVGSITIFRHLNREKIVPEHWYPRRNYGRSRIDEFLEWQQRNIGMACGNYFQQKWLLPILNKASPDDKNVRWHMYV